MCSFPVIGYQRISGASEYLPLTEYSIFISSVRKYKSEGVELNEAIRQSFKNLPDDSPIKSYLLKLGVEMINECLTAEFAVPISPGRRSRWRSRKSGPIHQRPDESCRNECWAKIPDAWSACWKTSSVGQSGYLMCRRRFWKQRTLFFCFHVKTVDMFLFWHMCLNCLRKLSEMAQ